MMAHAIALSHDVQRDPVCWEEVFTHFGTALDKVRAAVLRAVLYCTVLGGLCSCVVVCRSLTLCARYLASYEGTCGCVMCDVWRVCTFTMC